MASAVTVLGSSFLALCVLVWPGVRRRPPPETSAFLDRASRSGVGLRLRPEHRPARPCEGSSGSRRGRWPPSWPSRWAALWQSSRYSSRGRPAGAAGRAIAVVEALATQVRAGASPDAAWQLALELVDGKPTDDSTPTATSGPAARGESADPAWRALGAAWRLSEQTGAPLGDVLDRLAAGLRQELEVEAEVEASLAAPRATARLLAGLPLVGVALGELLGARPVAVLLGTSLGRGCALGGLLLAAAGQAWTRALVARVVRAARAG